MPSCSSRPSGGRSPRSAASSPTSRAWPRPTRSPASGISWRCCACATPRRWRRWSPIASPASRGSPGRTRWWPSRCSPSTTWRRSSRSATSVLTPRQNAPAAGLAGHEDAGPREAEAPLPRYARLFALVRRGADLAERTQRVLAVIAPAADGVLGPRPLERRPGGRPPRLNSGVRAREAPVECELREGGTPPVRLRRLVAAAFRPTLREELARFPPAGRRAAVAGLALLVVALVAAGILASRPGGTHVVHHGRPVYNLFHPGSLRRVPPGPGELLRLEGRGHGAPCSRVPGAPPAVPACQG